MNKIKEYLNYLFGLVILFLSALFFRKRMQNEQLESELRKEKTNAEIKDNERDRMAAREHADKLVDEYHKLRGDDK